MIIRCEKGMRSGQLMRTLNCFGNSRTFSKSYLWTTELHGLLRTGSGAQICSRSSKNSLLCILQVLKWAPFGRHICKASRNSGKYLDSDQEALSLESDVAVHENHLPRGHSSVTPSPWIFGINPIEVTSEDLADRQIQVPSDANKESTGQQTDNTEQTDQEGRKPRSRSPTKGSKAKGSSRTKKQEEITVNSLGKFEEECRSDRTESTTETTSSRASDTYKDATTVNSTSGRRRKTSIDSVKDAVSVDVDSQANSSTTSTHDDLDIEYIPPSSTQENDPGLEYFPPGYDPRHLRPYQQDAINAILEGQKQGVVRQLMAMPTGAGKTMTFSVLAKVIAQNTGTRVLIIVHREQLITQTVQALERVWPDVSIGCVQGKRNAYDRQVVVASIQTASGSKRLALLSEKDFGLCIVDEAHHTPARTYQEVLNALGFLPGTPGKLLLGVTATPYRCGKLLLNDTYQNLTYELTIGKLIDLGFICKVQARRIMTETDISSAKMKPGDSKNDSSDDDIDFNAEALSMLINTPARNNLVVKSYQNEASGRKAIAFCCSIQHAEDLSMAFQSHGISSGALHSKLHKNDQDLLLQQHRSGEIMVLTNVAILTEGYDDTSISCVMMSRPTRSQGLYTQCVGRGFRLHPGKTDCLVLDFTDVHHTLDRVSDLVSILDIIEEKNLTSHEGYTGPPPGVDRYLKWQLQGGFLDLYDKPKYSWVRYEHSFYLELKIDNRNRKLYLQLRPSETSPKDLWQLTYTFKPSSWVPSDWTPIGKPFKKECLGAERSWDDNLRAIQVCENDIIKLLSSRPDLNPFVKGLNYVNLSSAWRKEVASEKQIEFLKAQAVRLGIPWLELSEKEKEGHRSPKSGTAANRSLPIISKGDAADAIKMTFIIGNWNYGQQKQNWMTKDDRIDTQPATAPQEKFMTSKIQELRKLVSLRSSSQGDEWTFRDNSIAMELINSFNLPVEKTSHTGADCLSLSLREADHEAPIDGSETSGIKELSSGPEGSLTVNAVLDQVELLIKEKRIKKIKASYIIQSLLNCVNMLKEEKQ